MPTFVTLAEIHEAHLRVAGTAAITPLTPLPGTNIHIKAESAQPIGSFKLRGAFNMISQLTPEQLAKGVITYSSGNHAQGVAYAARALGSKAVIVMPDNAPQVKIDATRELGAEVVFVGPASSARKLKAEELAAEHGYAIIPPYDHPHILAGAATCVRLLPLHGGHLADLILLCISSTAWAALAWLTLTITGSTLPRQIFNRRS